MTIHPSLVIIIMFVAQLHVLKMICTTFCILGVRNYYKSCMDTDLIEEKSVSDLKEIISRLGGWPVVEGRYGRGIFQRRGIAPQGAREAEVADGPLAG